MRSILKTVLVSALVTIASAGFSQTKDTSGIGHNIKKAGKATGKVAKSAGKKVGEVGAKSAAKIKDKSLKEKGPNGQTLYIDKHQRKYYVNKEAKRIYIN